MQLPSEANFTSGDGPQDVPVNRSDYAAKVTGLAMRSDYTLSVTYGDRQRQFTRAQLLALPQNPASLPISCVEGWSAGATWTGFRMRDLLDRNYLMGWLVIAGLAVVAIAVDLWWDAHRGRGRVSGDDPGGR